MAPRGTKTLLYRAVLCVNLHSTKSIYHPQFHSLLSQVPGTVHETPGIEHFTRISAERFWQANPLTVIPKNKKKTAHEWCNHMHDEDQLTQDI